MSQQALAKKNSGNFNPPTNHISLANDKPTGYGLRNLDLLSWSLFTLLLTLVNTGFSFEPESLESVRNWRPWMLKCRMSTVCMIKMRRGKCSKMSQTFKDVSSNVIFECSPSLASISYYALKRMSYDTNLFNIKKLMHVSQILHNSHSVQVIIY